MWWYGRGYSGGSWLPDEKKANMWPGRENSGGSWPPAFTRSHQWVYSYKHVDSIRNIDIQGVSIISGV